MPRPRFQKLPEAKRRAILEAAATEFSAYGYEGASINRILESVDLSKGAAYYYFDDKADLFRAVVQEYTGQITDLLLIDPLTLTAETYWPTLLSLHREPIQRLFDTPAFLGISKALRELMNSGRLPPDYDLELTNLWDWLDKVLIQGQKLGVVRTDLPHDILVALVVGIDSAGDDWMIRHWNEITREQVDDLLTRLGKTIQLALAPASV